MVSQEKHIKPISQEKLFEKFPDHFIQLPCEEGEVYISDISKSKRVTDYNGTTRELHTKYLIITEDRLLSFTLRKYETKNLSGDSFSRISFNHHLRNGGVHYQIGRTPDPDSLIIANAYGQPSIKETVKKKYYKTEEEKEEEERINRRNQNHYAVLEEIHEQEAFSILNNATEGIEIQDDFFQFEK